MSYEIKTRSESICYGVQPLSKVSIITDPIAWTLIEIPLTELMAKRAEAPNERAMPLYFACGPLLEIYPTPDREYTFRITEADGLTPSWPKAQMKMQEIRRVTARSHGFVPWEVKPHEVVQVCHPDLPIWTTLAQTARIIRGQTRGMPTQYMRGPAGIALDPLPDDGVMVRLAMPFGADDRPYFTADEFRKHLAKTSADTDIHGTAGHAAALPGGSGGGGAGPVPVAVTIHPDGDSGYGGLGYIQKRPNPMTTKRLDVIRKGADSWAGAFLDLVHDLCDAARLHAVLEDASQRAEPDGGDAPQVGLQVLPSGKICTWAGDAAHGWPIGRHLVATVGEAADKLAAYLPTPPSETAHDQLVKFLEFTADPKVKQVIITKEQAVMCLEALRSRPGGKEAAE